MPHACINTWISNLQNRFFSFFSSTSIHAWNLPDCTVPLQSSFLLRSSELVHWLSVSWMLGYGFSSGRVRMWELGYKESWAPKNWCFWTVVLEETLESPLDFKEIQPVHPKGDQSWVFLGRTDVEAETPILWATDAKSSLIWCWERLKVGGEGDHRGWDGWMASLTQWTHVWASSRRSFEHFRLSQTLIVIEHLQLQVLGTERNP